MRRRNIYVMREKARGFLVPEYGEPSSLCLYCLSIRVVRRDEFDSNTRYSRTRADLQTKHDLGFVFALASKVVCYCKRRFGLAGSVLTRLQSLELRHQGPARLE
jgi:hypothetical protein